MVKIPTAEKVKEAQVVIDRTEPKIKALFKEVKTLNEARLFEVVVRQHNLINRMNKLLYKAVKQNGKNRTSKKPKRR